MLAVAYRDKYKSYAEKGKHGGNNIVSTLGGVFKFLPYKYTPYHGYQRRGVAKPIADSGIYIWTGVTQLTEHHTCHPYQTAPDAKLDVCGCCPASDSL